MLIFFLAEPRSLMLEPFVILFVSVLHPSTADTLSFLAVFISCCQ